MVTLISITNILLVVTDREDVTYCNHIESHVSAFDWHIYILSRTFLKVKIKVRHISVTNISYTAADRAALQFAIV